MPSPGWWPIPAALLLAGPALGAPIPRLPPARIAGVEVGGLTPYQARVRLDRALRGRLEGRILLTDGARGVPVSRRQLGLRLDTDGMVASARAGRRVVPLRLTAAPEAMRAALRRLAPRFAYPGRGARVVECRGAVRVDPGEYSRRVDVAASADRLAKGVRADPALRTVRLVVDRRPPRVRAGALTEITGRLGSYTTRFDPGQAKRVHNIRQAVKAIDGTILPPGATFSLNRTVGPRTHARGYLTAPVFADGKLVPGIGGGVSQVTGTLFNAALLAALPIVYYRTHARPVQYVPLGRDATVAWGRFDMKFRNDTDAPVFIACRVTGGRLTATLYGARRAHRRVTVAVAAQRKGPGQIHAKLFRTVRQGGRVVEKRQVGRSHYRWKTAKA